MNKVISALFIIVMAGFVFAQTLENEKPEIDAKVCIQKCKEAMKSGNADDAIKFAERAVELDGANSDYHFQLGLAYNVKTNHKDTGMMEKMSFANKMLEAWKKAVELDGKNIPARQGLVGYYLNAPSFAGGSVEKAVEQAGEIVKLDEMLGNMVYVGIHQKNGDLEKALDFAGKIFKHHMDCLKMGKKSPMHSEVLNGLGYALVKEGKNDKAVEIFKQNIQAFPDYFNTYDSLAETYMNMGNKKEAVENYEKALKLNPNKTDFEKKAFERQTQVLKELKN